MAQKTVTHDTFVIERNYPAAPERVFAAFADPAKKRRWFVEHRNQTVEHYELDFEVGGRERARLRLNEKTPLPGALCETEGIYQHIVPNSRVVSAATMSINGHCISASLVTVELLPSVSGTELILTHQAAFFEGSDGPEMRQEGWRKLLDELANELAS